MREREHLLAAREIAQLVEAEVDQRRVVRQRVDDEIRRR